ncbi:hypothetical protein [Chitinophaga tropicalis]|uniref:Uncharacterized protein n=1 Tax=Chitinophaga tropicalis TaxID=2683588 RepID=A0A7K1TYG4_9BACT|nr:hypothetical protein [Chitinophaga tropicalis]MVT07138.1 hypothetical protein [Chitinophaga tropicalis]
MKKKLSKTKEQDKRKAPSQKEAEKKRNKTFPGYPSHPAREDITYQGEQENLDMEKITRSSRINNELVRREGVNPTEFDDGLDIPGSELDDEQEMTGMEDEENNYYSLGGDRHEDLEEREDII